MGLSSCRGYWQNLKTVLYGTVGGENAVWKVSRGRVVLNDQRRPGTDTVDGTVSGHRAPHTVNYLHS
jgi:hypothetical protein